MTSTVRIGLVAFGVASGLAIGAWVWSRPAPDAPDDDEAAQRELLQEIGYLK